MKTAKQTATDAQSSTQCQQGSFQFQDHGSRQVVADFTGGQLSSDGGVLLLRELDRGLGLTRQVAACFQDRPASRYHKISPQTAQLETRLLQFGVRTAE
jgi:hypothetical protein